MDVISSKNVINIVRKTLNLIDERLINHGERVSYILYKMLECENEYTKKEIIMYTITGIFHDIGAYKNEEIDNMLQFETNNVWRHSIYGYLFLQYLSPLGNYAESVLYHHLDYNKLILRNCKHEAVAGYLNLADKIDVYQSNHQKSVIITEFEKYKNKKFSEKALQLFQKADEQLHILENISNGTYLDELNHVIEEAIFTSTEKEMFLKMLLYSIDFRSEYTVMHTITTVSIADQIGRLMNLEEKEQNNLHYGALLHDVGKITTPIEILEAPRKLIEVEMQIMRNHVAMSEFILKEYIDPDILEIAIRHHEKLDGSGYHKKLTGNQLSLPQRILAVADIISALCGNRSYKNSFNKDKILNILNHDANNGKISPEIVECVVLSYDQLMLNMDKDTSQPLHMYADIKTKYEVLYKQFLEY